MGSCPSKSDSIPIPVRRKTDPQDFLSDSDNTVMCDLFIIKKSDV